MCSCKLKQSWFSNAQFDLDKCAVAKAGHLYEEEAKEENNSNYFLWQNKGKEN